LILITNADPWNLVFVTPAGFAGGVCLEALFFLLFLPMGGGCRAVWGFAAGIRALMKYRICNLFLYEKKI
tara:strand:+ start:287 stop:496 length:210 start_codon:yes stop_codon:yes gene_type:complete